MTIANKFARRLCILLAAFGLIVGVGVAQAQTVIYYHTDALGSPVATTNAAGVVIERTEYEPYGQVLNEPVADGPGYTGHVSDAQTGLSYMQQRYYDPQIGRFLSMDPVTADATTGGNFNRYWYANNNPYKYTDPDGRLVQALWGVPIGIVVNISVQMAMGQGSMGDRFSQVKWGQVGVAAVAGGLSGGVSAIANTAVTTSGTIAVNVIGNAAVGAVATQANAQLEGRTASVSEVAKGAAISAGTAGAGAAISAAPAAIAKSASAGMTQTQRTAVANLLQGIKNTTPGFKHSNPLQTGANAVGTAVSSSGDLAPLLDDKKKRKP